MNAMTIDIHPLVTGRYPYPIGNLYVRQGEHHLLLCPLRMTRWSLFLQTLSLLHHFLGLYSPEEKIRIVLEGFRRETNVNDLCRREGIKPYSYYAWTKGFMEARKERLTRDSVRDATRQEIEQLKPESTEGGRRVSVLKRQEGAPVLLG